MSRWSMSVKKIVLVIIMQKTFIIIVTMNVSQFDAIMLIVLLSIITTIITIAFLFSSSTMMGNSLTIVQVHVVIMSVLHRCKIALVDVVIGKIKIITIKLNNKLSGVIKAAMEATVNNKIRIILFQVVVLMCWLILE